MIKFIEDSSSSYVPRTYKNATADVTFAIATNYNTRGEIVTKKAASGKLYIGDNLNLKPENLSDQELINKIVKILNKKFGDSEISFNIAGNGIYSLNFPQKTCDIIVYKFLKSIIKHKDFQPTVTLIRTGGQTGVDEAGAKAGNKLGIKTVVLMPKGYKFRGKDGIDISDKKKSLARFKS